MAKDLVINNGKLDTTKLVGAPNVRQINYILNADAEVDTTGWSTYAESDSVTFQDTGDTVTLNAHTLQNGNAVAFTSITSTTGISTNTVYYVVNAATNTFQLATSVGGSALALTTNGSGTLVRSLPKAGTGGTPQSNLWIRSTTTPLRGAASFRIDKTGSANREGQGVSYAFTLDKADQAKVLTVSFDYEVASGTYTDGDVTVYLYDVTNSVLIQPAGYIVQSVTSGTENKHIATFQTSATGISYRLLFHISKPSTSDYSLALDNITVGPQVVQYGAPITDWISYTPTSSSSNVTLTGKYRRVGDSLEGMANLSFTGAASATVTISMPSGITIDTTKLTQTTNPVVVGSVVALDNGTAWYVGTAVWESATSNQITMYLNNVINRVNNGNNPFTIANGDLFAVDFKVPIVGWSSTVQMSNDTDTRVVSSQFGIGTASLSHTAGAVIVYPKSYYDTHGAYNTSNGNWTCPVSGIYDIYSSEYYSTGATYIQIYKNGSYAAMATYFTTTSGVQSFAHAISLNAGDVLTFRSTNTVSTSYAAGFYENKITITRRSGPSAIAATELVAAQARLTNSQSISNQVYTKIQFNSESFDTHGAYDPATNYRFTAPIGGIYRLDSFISSGNGNANFGSNEVFWIVVYKNGALIQRIGDVTPSPGGTGTVGDPSVGGTYMLQLTAGDYVEMYCYQSSGASFNLTEGFFGIHKL